MSATLPPGPVNFNAAIGLTWRHYYRLRTNPIEFARQMSREYGDITFFRIFLFRAFLVNHPELIRQVLVSQSGNFPKFDRILNHLRQATGDGLLVTEGEVWRRQRAVAQKVFRSRQMDVFGRITGTQTSAMLDHWNHRDRVQIEHEMTLLLQDAMGQAFFGEGLGSDDRIAESVREYSDIFHHESRAIFNLPDWIPTAYKRKKRDSIKLLRRTLTQIITRRLTSGQRHDDFLDLLLHTDGNQGGAPAARQTATQIGQSRIESVRSQLLTIYLASFHTTSVAMAWLLFAVARNPVVQQSLRDEILQVCGNNQPSLHHLDDLKYASMVVKESLRLYPPAWELFARKSIQPTKLGGYLIPANSLVFILPFVTQRDPRFFAEPEKFDPLRFSPQRKHEFPQFAYIPFGAGPHKCIGDSLATMQMSLILAAILQRFELTLDENEAHRVRVDPKVSARPAGDITILLKKHPVGAVQLT